MHTVIEIISPNCVSEFYSRESRRNPRRMIKAAGKSLFYCLKSVTKKEAFKSSIFMNFFAI